MTFTLLPAVDVVDGQAVRLDQGEAGTEKSYGTPLESALKWQEQGAEWLHFVDLDAAFNRGSNHELMAEVISNLDIKVELTGGIRDDASLKRALDTGVQRVNIGTAALENPEWIARQLGHANTSMLFRVYSRYVPNLVGRDGAAFESLLNEEFTLEEEV